MLIEKIWNGKGKLYDENENLYFEGEYLDGQIQGKFKKYYTQDTQMEIEGECINWYKNGKIKKYYKNVNLKYEGDYWNNR